MKRSEGGDGLRSAYSKASTTLWSGQGAKHRGATLTSAASRKRGPPQGTSPPKAGDHSWAQCSLPEPREKTRAVHPMGSTWCLQSFLGALAGHSGDTPSGEWSKPTSLHGPQQWGGITQRRGHWCTPLAGAASPVLSATLCHTGGMGWLLLIQCK